MSRLDFCDHSEAVSWRIEGRFQSRQVPALYTVGIIDKANFLAGQIERPSPAHGSPSGETAGTHSQNEPNSVDLGSTPTSRILRGIASYSARMLAL